MKKEIVEFLKPDRNKIIATFLYPYLFLALTFTLYGIAIITGRDIKMPNLTEISYYNVIVRALEISLISYPFICSIFTSYRLYKLKGIKGLYADKSSLSLILFGFVIFNPVSLVLATSYIKYTTWLTCTRLNPGLLLPRLP